MHKIGCILLVALLIGSVTPHWLGEANAHSLAEVKAIQDEIVAGSVLDIQTLNPCLASDDYTLSVLGLVYDALAYINRSTGNAEPGLAESWESSDGLTWIVKLRQNIKWHDGQPLTADDVVFTYNFMLNPENPLKHSEYFSFLKWEKLPGSTDKNETYWEAVQKVDSSSIRFVLNRTVWDFGITILSLPILKKDIWQNHWADALSWDLDYNPSSGTSKSVGSGPYKLVSWLPGQTIVFQPNTEYYKTVNTGITIKKYAAYESLLDAAKHGEIALVFHPVPAEFLAEFTGISTFSAFPYPSRTITFLGFNLEKYFEGYDEGSGYEQRSSVDDPISYPVKPAGTDAGLQFRSAVVYLAPHGLIEESYPNLLKWENSLVPKESQYYNNSLKTYTFNLTKTISLLDSANYKDLDGDGWREDYAGREMGHDGVIKIYIAERNTVKQQIAMGLADALRNAGVNANTEPIQVLNIRDYDLFLTTVKIDENFEYLYRLINTKYDYTDGITNGENLWRYRNPDTDNLTESMLSGPDFSNVIKHLQGIVSTHLPIIPIYSEILYNVVDTAKIKVSQAVNESLLEKHNILSMQVNAGTTIEAYAVPARLNAISGSNTEIIVRASDENKNPLINTQTRIRITPSDALAPDATTKTTDSKGCAFFTLSLTKTLDSVKFVAVEVTAANSVKRFYIALEPMDIEINIVSELFLKGLANNTYTFSFQIQNSGVGVKNAFSRVIYVSDGRIVPVGGENLSDIAGNAAFQFLISEDFGQNSYLQISFAISVAGGEERAYTAGLVVTTAGSSQVNLNTISYGVDWKTGRGVIEGNVSYEGNPVGVMNVKCGIMELDGFFELENTEGYTDSQGRVSFNVSLTTMPEHSRFFNYFLIVCTPEYHGAVYSRSLLQIPEAIELTAEPSSIEIKGEPGRSASAAVHASSEGISLPRVQIFAWKDTADAKISVLGVPASTNSTGALEITLLINGDYTDNGSLSITLKGLFWGRENSCVINVAIARASIPQVSLTLSQNELEGTAGKSVKAEVYVAKEGQPIPGVNVTLVVSTKTGIEISPEYEITDANGMAEFEIIVKANFTKETNLTLSAKATMNGSIYTSSPSYLIIYPAGTTWTYVVSLSIPESEIKGKQGEAVMVTGNLKRGDTPLSGVNFTLVVTGSTDILIEPQVCVTDTNGNAYFTLTITKNLDKDVDVVLRGKAVINGNEYFSQPVTLKIKAYVEQKTPGFDLPVFLLALLILSAMALLMRKKDYIGKRFKA